ncbi:MAG: sigma-54-dependent transcriptional regulator [Polyangiales bacterium]
MSARPRVLVVDDREALCATLQSALPELDLVQVTRTPPRFYAEDGPEALACLSRLKQRPTLVLLDMHFDLPPERLLPLGNGVSLRRQRRFQGLAILRALRQKAPDLPVLLLTSERDLSIAGVEDELALRSMTYLLEPADLDTLHIRIHSVLDAARGDAEDGLLWGKSTAMLALRRRMRLVAQGPATVLLEGETGTGKSFFAEHFVHPQSGRNGPFVLCDLSTVPQALLPAHLFGTVRGAYTGATHSHKGVFAQADGGTLLLDEIQNAPLELQKQLLLVLQDGRFRPLGAEKMQRADVKVIAASNEDLAAAVRAGRFRADLYMRLSPATRLRLPPLRERPEDLAGLVVSTAERALQQPATAHLLEALWPLLPPRRAVPVQVRLLPAHGAAHAEDKALQPHAASESLSLALTQPAWQLLKAHPWPGNLRELAMVMQNLVCSTLMDALEALRAGVRLAQGRLQIDTALVQLLLSATESMCTAAAPASAPDALAIRLAPQASLNAVAQDVERQYLQQLFRAHAGDLSAMAEHLLGDAKRSRAVRLRLNQLGLSVRDLRQR